MTAAANGLVSADFEPCNNAVLRREYGQQAPLLSILRVVASSIGEGLGYQVGPRGAKQRARKRSQPLRLPHAPQQTQGGYAAY